MNNNLIETEDGRWVIRYIDGAGERSRFDLTAYIDERVRLATEEKFKQLTAFFPSLQ